jgi:hypothetical protein
MTSRWQFYGNFRELIYAHPKPARIDRQVLTLDKPRPSKLAQKRNILRRISLKEKQVAEVIRSSRLLRRRE